MKKKRFFALLLTAVMVLYTPMFAFADAGVQGDGKAGAVEETKDGENVSNQGDRQKAEAGTTGEKAVATPRTATPAPAKTTKEITVSGEWDPSDFTYTTMEQTLYGCDYSRQFNVKGVAISGFSVSGSAKLVNNKDLVIPSTDTEGNKLVGIANGAFKKWE